MLTAPGDQSDIALKQYAQKMRRTAATISRNRYGEGARADERTTRPGGGGEDPRHSWCEQHEGLTLLHAALGQAQAKAGHPDEALRTFKHAAELFPRNVPVTVRYAETLMLAGRAADAHTMLLDLFNNVPPTPEQIRLTALAACAAGDAGDAYFYMGEYQIAGGDLPMAAQQLQLALAAPNLSQIQRARYQARLDEVRDYLASTRKRQLASDNQRQ